jgi:protease PrsW
MQSPLAGWYQDPTGIPQLRYYDQVWTAHVCPLPSPKSSVSVARGIEPSIPLPSKYQAARTKLPRWLPLPALIASPLILLYLVVCSIREPFALVFALLPLLVVGLPLYLIDRLTPRPAYTRVAAFLFGATASITAAIILESPTAIFVRSQFVTVFVAGPVEELAIFAGLWWIVHRLDVTTALESIIIVGWCALGFAVIEDVEYFALSPHHLLTAVVIARGLITPFGHPLFSSCSAVGYALYRRRRKVHYLVLGLVVAAVLHTSWDTVAVWISENVKHTSSTTIDVVVFVYAIGFFAIFVTWVTLILVAHHREYRAQCLRFPAITSYVGLPPGWVNILATPRLLRHYRAGLPKHARPGFDDIVSTLSSMSHRPPLDPMQTVLAAIARWQYHSWLAAYTAPAPLLLSLR